ncbi:hypothetical protein DFR44_10194 [Hydromonas duriensis]|uniref:Uncharacterized protein n=1 Tax=Hydromonas duriensis TaxID=1527608 RepID=A0A4R6YBR9_9BURK|nr:hypothetical protein DFR44_10194 [Hydromonas duriensis]
MPDFKTNLDSCVLYMSQITLLPFAKNFILNPHKITNHQMFLALQSILDR